MNNPERTVSRREHNKVEKRARIMAAARRLFAERGFEGTSAAAVAEAAGVAVGTLYLYVTSKEDLLIAVFREDVDRAWSEAFAGVDPSQPLIEQLLALFEHIADYHERDPAAARLYFRELLFVSAPVSDRVEEFMRWLHHQLSSLLDDSQRRGLFDPAVPARHLASVLFSVWYVLMQRRHSQQLSREAVKVRLEADFRLVLRQPAD